ncbi:MAG TPA: hypothetical protein VK936_05140 [Longimicrobiales bacterium]|nr:hypothetical protein [Longimicrobiales bacterium]
MHGSIRAGQENGGTEDAHMRELVRACGTFMEAVEADPALNSTTRLAAAGVAAALQRLAEDWPAAAREWREVRSRAAEMQYQVQGLERQVGELYRIMSEEEEWPTLL